jgi:hypothetical protein
MMRRLLSTALDGKLLLVETDELNWIPAGLRCDIAQYLPEESLVSAFIATSQLPEWQSALVFELEDHESLVSAATSQLPTWESMLPSD